MGNRILLIDDDQDLLDILHEFLTGEGFIVKTLSKINELFVEIETYKPELIVIDYILYGPNEFGVNGGEVCHQIKMNPKTGHIPVAILSAHPKVLFSLGTYNSDVIIAKPFDLAELTDTLRVLLSAAK
jgi:DNA-binding response OmpR family regulator